jgi:glycosyltransferase involved in cell wall biosynthesis
VTQIPILHLGNVVADSSSGRIIQRLVAHLGGERYSWHIGGLRGLWGNLPEEFVRLGAQVVDFSDCQNGSRHVARRIREYVSANEVRIVHTHSPRTSLAATPALVGMRRTRHLLTNHSLYSRRDRHWGLLYAMLNRIALYLPDHVIAVSQTMRRQIVRLPGLSAQRVTAIRNAIDCATYYAPEEREHCRSEFRLSSRAQLLAASLGISHAVIWTGFRQDVPRLLSAMDVYVQASVNEGLCLSILEAMAAGKPVIATDVGGTREVLTHQETGILIPPGSSSVIGAAIVDLLDHPEKRAALAVAARDRVVQEFGVQRMVEGYQRVYEALVSQV